MLFSYKAVGGDGEIDEDKREAVSREDLARTLSNEGKTVLHIEKAKTRRGSLLHLSIFNNVSSEEKVSFAKNLSVMLRAGLPIDRALSVIERQSNNTYLKKIVAAITESINKGDSLSSSLEKFPKVFNRLFVAMVHSGEESGKLSEALLTVSLQLGRSESVVKKIRDAMIYPIIIILLMVGVGVVMMIYVVPQLTATFTSVGATLPLETRLIIDLSNTLQNDGLWILLGVIVLIFLFTIFKKTKRGSRILSWLALRTPFVKLIVTESNAARMARTTGSLLSSSVDMIEALKISEEVTGNIYFKDVIREAQEKIQKGSTLSRVLLAHEDIFPPYLGESASVGEETGDLASMLLSVADSYEADVEEKMKDLSTVIEPVLMVCVGIAVGFFAIAVITPMYSLVNDF